MNLAKLLSMHIDINIPSEHTHTHILMNIILSKIDRCADETKYALHYQYY